MISDGNENKNNPKNAYNAGYKSGKENEECEIDFNKELEYQEITNRNAINAFIKGYENGKLVRMRKTFNESEGDIKYDPMDFIDD